MLCIFLYEKESLCKFKRLEQVLISVQIIVLLKELWRLVLTARLIHEAKMV